MRFLDEAEGLCGSRPEGPASCRCDGARVEPAGRKSPRHSLILLVVLALAAVPSGGPSRAQTPPDEGLWTIGNCNLDRRFDLADAVMMLDYLFAGTARVPCVPLCEVTGDSRFDIADAIAVLSYLFNGKPMGAATPLREEECDAMIDNDCDGLRDEGCSTEGMLAVDLAWDPVTRDAEGNPELPFTYRLYIGTRSLQYDDVRNVGVTAEYRVHGLAAGTRYYFALTAIDRAGNESGYSNEVSAVAEPVP